MGLVRLHALVEGLIGPRHAEGVVREVDQPLEVDLLHAGLGRHPHEGGQLRQGLLEPGEPSRDPGLRVALSLLQRPEGPDVLQNPFEIVLSAHGDVRGACRRIERDAQLVQAGLDQGPSVLLGQHRAVGVEQDVGSAILEVAHHPGQVLDQHRLADPVKHGAAEIGT